MENIYLVSVSSLAAWVYFRNIRSYKCAKSDENENSESKISESVISSFKRLQCIYLPAHLLALFSDWLQGPYVYQLYREYGHGEREIALLFLTGYLSSCIFGGLTGPLSDKYGRKRLGQIFCVICILNCLSKISANSYILLV